jgi:Tfp pilus assembly protein PilO
MSARRAVWRRRLPLLLGAVLFAFGNLALYLTYRSSTQTRREALEARRDDLRRSVEAREAEAEKLSVQRERLSGVSAAMEEFYGNRVGSQRETLAAVVAQVHALLEEAGVTTTQISYATTDMTNLPLSQMKMTFPVKCDYGRFKRLLKSLETGRRWIVVRSVSIQRDNEQAGQVQVQMELVTYFAEPGAAPSVPEKTGKSQASGAVAARRAG